MSKLKVLDLFSGIGGFSLGLERTNGFQTVAFCEIETYCQAVLRKHWPEVPIYDDVRKLSVGRLASDGIEPDVICGGFPCQDISVAGKGEGIEGERSGLWSEFARLIGEVRPRYAIVENVSALLSRGMDVVLGDLAALRFDAEWHCIPASAAGAPHRRDRVWIVAYPDSGRAAQQARGEREFGLGPFVGCEVAPNTHSHGLRQQPGRRIGPSGSGEAKPGNHGTPRPLADAYAGDEQRRGGSLQMGWGRFASQALADGDAGRTQWSTEPDVGGSHHGFPAWLGRCVGRGLSYAESLRRCKVLRNLWSRNVSQALWRASGGLERLSQAEVLLSFVREYEAGSDQARLLVAGKEASEEFLRSLRLRATTRSAPRRSGHGKQRSIQHSDSVQPLPRLLARGSEADWTIGSWEDAIPRTARDIPDRVNRLGGSGNAVVPQIPEIIGNAILAAHSDAQLKSVATRSDERVADCRDACLTHNYTRRAS